LTPLWTYRTPHKSNDETKTCVAPASRSNWLVFTAGCMGAGKGHTLQHLQREGLFPLNAFVRVDPDVLREVYTRAAYPVNACSWPLDRAPRVDPFSHCVGLMTVTAPFNTLERAPHGKDPPLASPRPHHFSFRPCVFTANVFHLIIVDTRHQLLPETPEYIRRDRHTAGYLTQKEVGYICEVTSDAPQPPIVVIVSACNHGHVTTVGSCLI